MNRLFFYLLLGVMGLAFLLFVPITLQTDVHYDMNRRKFAFVVYIYKRIKIIGGYIATYAGGFALHVSPKRVILVPYANVNSERKKFSFMKTFRLITLRLTAETGAEYLFPVATVNTALRAYFLAKGGDINRVENNLWLTDGDVLRLSVHSVVFFNLYMLTVNFLKFLKEKIRILWQRKKKSTT
ncbi:MAG: hypothetical protein IJA89_03740 [Clostridia bacterium]|nr:hypothetical protein [Clostridia bacterium]